jgi:plasmid maintenance system antidote protein VapI
MTRMAKNRTGMIALSDDETPAIIIPPGDTLREVLRVHGLTQTEFAKSIGRPLRVITAETALQFEQSLGI